MKVIHLISGGDTGGAKTHVLGLLQNLHQEITVQLVCFREGEFAEDARALGIPTEVISGNNILHTCKTLERYIQQGGFEIIHCHGSRANMIGALLKRRLSLPTVTTVHSDYRLDYLGRPMGRLVYGTINAIALRQLDYRIGVSDTMVDILIRRGFAPDRFYAIYNGLDFTPISVESNRLDYLRQLGADVDEDSVVVGIAARLNPVKDIATLIRGFAHANCPNLRLVIAGDGEEREKLQALAEELGVSKAVCFAGWISGGMNDFYAALDINTLTSISETFPYALTEGARFHLPTVASAVGGVPRLIDNGVNGFTFPAGDFQMLGDRLRTLAQNPSLRKEMGERLYQKAAEKYSIRATVDTQLHIYADILRRTKRHSPKRDGVVICGAYGRGNAGDDAILAAILADIRSIDPDLPICVLSRNPKETRLQYRVQAVHSFSPLRWLKRMAHSRLYINGGGSLVQDVTSRRSLWYYLLNIAVAKLLGNRVQMYGCGIGPVLRTENRRLSARILNRFVDVITLREPDSLQELQNMGVTKPQLLLTADPALRLPAASETAVDTFLLGKQIPLEGNYFAICLRHWRHFNENTALLGRIARFVYETYGLTPVFLSIEKHQDPIACRQAAKEMGDIPHYFVDGADDITLLIGTLSRMKVVISMRLHALIFSASQGVPLVGLVYDPKVSAFLRYIGQENFLDFETLEESELKLAIERAIRQSPEIQAEAVARLKTLAERNQQIAAELLQD